TSIFIGAYIWRATASINNVVLYFIGVTLLLSVGFFLNGLLLRHFSIRALYGWGALLAGLSNAAAVFIHPGSLLAVFAYGGLRGVCMGLYWANRNYLELQETLHHQRQYFYG